jgi:hypothetical protein
VSPVLDFVLRYAACVALAVGLGWVLPESMHPFAAVLVMFAGLLL